MMFHLVLVEAGASSKALAENSGRTQAVPSDVTLALVNMGLDIRKLPREAQHGQGKLVVPPRTNIRFRSDGLKARAAVSQSRGIGHLCSTKVSSIQEILSHVDWTSLCKYQGEPDRASLNMFHFPHCGFFKL